MPEFYTWTILLINQLDEIGEKQLSVFGSRGDQIWPLMHIPLWCLYLLALSLKNDKFPLDGAWILAMVNGIQILISLKTFYWIPFVYGYTLLNKSLARILISHPALGEFETWWSQNLCFFMSTRQNITWLGVSELTLHFMSVQFYIRNLNLILG